MAEPPLELRGIERVYRGGGGELAVLQGADLSQGRTGLGRGVGHAGEAVHQRGIFAHDHASAGRGNPFRVGPGIGPGGIERAAPANDRGRGLGGAEAHEGWDIGHRLGQLGADVFDRQTTHDAGVAKHA